MKKVWYLLFPLLVCLILPFPHAAATETEPNTYAENGFVGEKMDDGFIRLIRYEGELGDDGKLEFPATIQEIEVKKILSLERLNSEIRNALKEVRLPEGLQDLGPVFQNCAALTTVYIPSTLETATSPFSGCDNLTSVEFGVSLPRVPATLFQNCTGLTEISLPAMATVIGDKAFYGCSNLENVIFSDRNYLTTIGESAFQGCVALKNLTLPAGLKTVNTKAFYRCTSLETVKMSDGLETLGNSAFAECAALKKVWIPASLVSAGSASKPVFTGCPALNDNLSYDEMPYDEAPEGIFFQDGVTSIVNNLFAKCTGLKRITIPNTVTSIGSGAFAESGLESVEIPRSVTSYGKKAFQNCTSLTSAKLSDMAPQIPDSMFYQCSFLETLDVNPATVTRIDASAFYECKRLKNLPAWAALTSIRDFAFYWCEELASITLPESLTSLGESAFQHNHMLNTVVIPATLTQIPASAFAQCYRLSDISIPKSVTTIDSYAFYQDTDLTRVFIPLSVTTINSQAFSYIDQMTIEGVAGSYAQDWATRNGAKAFEDKSVPIQKISLAGGADSMILPKGGNVAPVFVVEPADNTDLIKLESSSSSVAVRNGYILYCTKNINSDKPVSITATSAIDGVSFTFTVTCEEMTGLRLTPPVVTDYAIGEAMDWFGVQAEAVFKSGASQIIYNPSNADINRDKVLAWTASGADLQSAGEKTVEVTYNGFSATFPVRVFASATDVPLVVRDVERTENGFRVWTHGVAGDAKFCALVSFDADGGFLRAVFKTLSATELAQGYADFNAVEQAAVVKAVLLKDNTLAPVQTARALAVNAS